MLFKDFNVVGFIDVTIVISVISVINVINDFNVTDDFGVIDDFDGEAAGRGARRGGALAYCAVMGWAR